MFKNNFSFSSISKDNKKSPVGIVLMGLIIGLISTVIIIAFFSFIMLALKIDRAYSALFATVSVAFGAFSSAFAVAKKSSIRGYICGGITGISYFIAILIISMIVDKTGFTSNTLFHLIIILLSGVVGGILGANNK